MSADFGVGVVFADSVFAEDVACAGIDVSVDVVLERTDVEVAVELPDIDVDGGNAFPDTDVGVEMVLVVTDV